MYDTLYVIINKCENATLQYSIFREKVFNKKHLLKLNNVFQTSSKLFVEIPPICLFLWLSYVSFVFKALFTDLCNCSYAKYIVTLIRICHTWVAFKHKKTDLSLEKAQKSVLNLSNL